MTTKQDYKVDGFCTATADEESNCVNYKKCERVACKQIACDVCHHLGYAELVCKYSTESKEQEK